MNGTTKLGLASLGAALVLGVLGDMLLRTPGFGLNAFLWILGLLAGIWFLVRREAVPHAADGRWLFAAALLAAAGFLWHDSPAMLLLDVAALAVTFGLMAGFGRTGGLGRTSVIDYIVRGLSTGLMTAFGPFMLVLRDIKWTEIPHSNRSGQAAAVLRGLLIALPLVIIFGALFMAADAVFEHMVTRAFGFSIDQVISHIIFGGFWAWITAGFLWVALVQQPAEATLAEKPQAFTLGLTETVIVLGLLNLLFLSFVLVQFRYFFGGAALVEASTGLTYADYARRGFFELTAVSALVLPVLILSHYLLPKAQAAQERVYRWLAAALVVQLFVIMASAMKRMILYERAFGLTELRLYTTAFMIWLAALFIWFGVTVLRGRWERFAAGVLVSGYVALVTLHGLNPDALIARVNVSRLEIGRRFDSQYLTTLSADAVPVLLNALPKLEEPDRRFVAQQLLDRWGGERQGDWRTWNWGRNRAQSAVRAQLPELKSAAQ